MMDIRVQQEAFDLGRETAGFAADAQTAGAVVTFTGIVRNDGGDLLRLEIEHYPGMTGKALTQIAQEAKTRWTLENCLVIHRYGALVPGDHIMMVATAARHRADAFAAAEFLMDYLKSRAPFWKKEIRDGGDAWVAAKEDDEKALDRW